METACDFVFRRWSSCIWTMNIRGLRSPRDWASFTAEISTMDRSLPASAAEKFANDSLDFFKMRRCVDDLHPDPAFPGCIYSEMKMCLAPCFKGCSDADYHAEVSRVQNFFDSGGHSLLREISLQRDQASTDLAFEEAAAHHARIEKLKPVLGQLPEIVRRIDRLAGLIVQPSAVPESVTFFRFDQGCLRQPSISQFNRRSTRNRNPWRHELYRRSTLWPRGTPPAPSKSWSISRS